MRTSRVFPSATSTAEEGSILPDSYLLMACAVTLGVICSASDRMDKPALLRASRSRCPNIRYLTRYSPNDSLTCGGPEQVLNARTYVRIGSTRTDSSAQVDNLRIIDVVVNLWLSSQSTRRTLVAWRVWDNNKSPPRAKPLRAPTPRSRQGPERAASRWRPGRRSQQVRESGRNLPGSLVRPVVWY